MSNRVLTTVWNNSKAKGTTLLVLVKLADRSGDDGIAFPGIESLAKDCRMTERNVRRRLQQLVELGELDIAYQQSQYGTNLYRVLLPISEREDAPAPPSDKTGKPKGDTRAPQGRTPASEREDAPAPQDVREPSVEPSTRNELWDAVLDACRIDSKALTKTERGDLGKTIAELLAIGAEPRQVKAKAGEWRKRYPTSPVTHRVLRGHWGELSSNGARREPEPEPPPIDEEGQAKLRTLVDSLSESKRV